jgi:hypothetical protein
MAYRKDWGQPQVGNQGFVGTRKMLGRRVTLLLTDLVLNNTIGCFMVPAGFTVDGCAVNWSDMDGGTSASFSLGDAALATRFLNGDVTPRTGGLTVALAATGLLYKFPADTEVLITISVAPGAPIAGTADVYLSGFVTP